MCFILQSMLNKKKKSRTYGTSDWLREITWLLGADPLGSVGSGSGMDQFWLSEPLIGSERSHDCGRGSALDPLSILSLWLAKTHHMRIRSRSVPEIFQISNFCRFLNLVAVSLELRSVIKCSFVSQEIDDALNTFTCIPAADGCIPRVGVGGVSKPFDFFWFYRVEGWQSMTDFWMWLFQSPVGARDMC